MAKRIIALVRPEPTYKAVALQSCQAVFLAPIRVHRIEQPARNRLALVETDRLTEELNDVAIIRKRVRRVGAGLFALGEPVTVCDQPPQPVQHPTEYLFPFGEEFLRKERIVNAVCGFGLCRKNEQAARPALCLIVEIFRGAVPKTDKAAVEQGGKGLMTFCLNVYRNLRGDDVLDNTRGFEGG